MKRFPYGALVLCAAVRPRVHVFPNLSAGLPDRLHRRFPQLHSAAGYRRREHQPSSHLGWRPLAIQVSFGFFLVSFCSAACVVSSARVHRMFGSLSSSSVATLSNHGTLPYTLHPALLTPHEPCVTAVTMNNHHFGVTPDSFASDYRLSSTFNVLSTNLDRCALHAF